jgi:NAD(P)H-hydrate epimerase
MKISKVEEMRNLDKCAIEDYGIVAELLMENAGQAAYFVILDQIGIKGKDFVILCGSGNNGGDGLVVARKIHSQGGTARVFLMSDADKFKGSARKNFEIVSKLPIEVRQVEDLEELRSWIMDCDVIVDGILGTGITRDVTGRYRDVINLINTSNKIIVSIDIPSGINGNTGKIMGVAVRSDYTITYGLPKVGNILYPGFEHGGKLYVTHISFPPELHNKPELKIEVGMPSLLPKNGRKDVLGKILFIAGAKGHHEPPYYLVSSFLKMGGGYSRLATPRSVMPFITNEDKEIVFVPLEETESGSIAMQNKDQILEIAEQIDMVIIGPGVSLNEETQELIRILAKEIERPLLISDDGITAISKDTEVLRSRTEPTVLTLNLDELSKITSKDVAEIEENIIEILQEQAKTLNSIIVLKDARSLICYPNKTVHVNMSGNPRMVTSGSGDVLMGIIAAIFGLNISIEDVLMTSIFIHGLSADLAVEKKGKKDITAQDIMDYLPLTLKEYREREDEILSNFYHSIYPV